MGAYGWCVMTTYSGKLLENACQATANRILRHGQHRLEAAGYPVVLHVYDENAGEVETGFGSIEAFEAEMNVMPPWAADWPIKAKGGWRGRRYRK
jgi:DNA polymerase